MTRFFAHTAGEQCLTDGVVYLVRAGVVQVFALQPDLRAAQMLGQSRGMVNGARAADVVFQIVVELFPKRRVVFRCFIGIRQLLQGGNQCFGDIKSAVFAEKALLVGRVVVFHRISSLSVFSDGLALRRSSEREIVGNYNCFSHKPAISKNARYAAAFFAKLKG